jgi:Swi5-dependent recombination DNA repair protein 1
MSTPQAKRRRLNDATKTLHKPFKSPFRTPLKPNLGSDPPSSDPPELGTVSARALTDSGISQEHLVSNRATPDRSTANLPKPLLPRSGLPAPTRPRLLQKKTSPSKPSLTREIIELRNDIQILSQAHALATSSKDDDLFALVERWRTASRAAAEELFASTRDRVNRMGGVGAWKDREREQKEWEIKAEREEIEIEREKLEEARENGEVSEEAYEQYADVGVGAEQEEKETFKAADDDVSRMLGLPVTVVLIISQSFTMDMMLKTLNIDLDLIGYNKEAQRWDG